MYNWLGQKVNIGDYVYRGARDGNTSSSKIGRVVNEGRSKVRVHWLYEAGWKVIRDSAGVYINSVPGATPLKDSFGTLERKTLFVIEPGQAKEIIERLENEPN